ncbi:IS3 family transposase [Palleronia rufa]|uniref:IS3 family transposase n=1 Tax=Palleronia rufa TaxID=1530186 RepID=UPI000AB5A908|nr:IS3 family transposase [Palleronia rufa]
MIRGDHPELGVSQQCRLVKLSRSAFYYMPVGIDAKTLALMKAIDRVFTKYPFFGSRQIAAYLRRDGIVAGRHRVRRLMAKMGLEAIYKRPKTSQPHPRHLDLSRFRAAPSARLSHFSFECDGAFPAQC